MKKTIWDHLLLIILIVIIILASSCQYEPFEEYEKPKPPIEKIDYKKPSYFFKHNLLPPFDLLNIAAQFNLSESIYGAFDTGVAYADFNEDGRIDISMALATGNGDGEFVKHVLLLNEGEGKWKDGTYLISNPYYQAFSSRKTIIGDFNDDGKPDVVRPTGAHEYLDYPYIMLSNEYGYTFKSLGGDKRDSHTVSSGDIDNDGDLDLVFAGETSEGVAFAINDGQANFSWSLKWTNIHESYTSEMLDLNKDGNIDLILGGRFYDEREIKGLHILWGSGNGNFSFENYTSLYNNFKTITGPDDLLFSDIDKDGNLDLFIVTLDLNGQGSILESFKGSSDFTFTNNTPDWFDFNTTSKDWVWLFLKDRNKDGKVDLFDPSKFNGQSFEWNGSKFIRK